MEGEGISGFSCRFPNRFMFNFFIFIVIVFMCRDTWKASPTNTIVVADRERLLSTCEGCFSSFLSYFWIVHFYLNFSHKFLLISFLCSHNDYLHRYQTMKNRRNIKYIFGNTNMWKSPRFIFCHRGGPWFKKVWELLAYHIPIYGTYGLTYSSDIKPVT